MSESAAEFFEKLRRDDPEVVLQIWMPLRAILVRNADRLLRQRRSGEVDAEDVAQSAIRTFLRRLQDGQFQNLKEIDELHRLLAVITYRKAIHRLRCSRKMLDEATLDKARESGSGRAIETLAMTLPSHEFELICQECFDALPDETHCLVALMVLKGFTQKEIAQEIGRTERMVRVKLERIRRVWKKQLQLQ